MDAPRRNLYDLTLPELTAWLGGWGFGSFHAQKVWTALYRSLAATHSEIAAPQKDALAHRLLAESDLGTLDEVRALESSDGLTRKFLLGLRDGKRIETVLMQHAGRATACVSTQAGCAMGCVFCATGQMGFERNLTPGEIVAQLVHVSRLQRVRNIVLMGMGEPLHNYDAVMGAVDIVTDPRGLAIGPRFITLSTVGIVPGIRRLAEDKRGIQLAVSLHGATDAERNALVPVGRKWGLAELMDACREYCAKRRRRIFFEWALIEGRNDGAEQAHALGALLQGMDAHVNVIPLNPSPGYGQRPSSPERVHAFQQVLSGYGLRSTVRQRRGIDIDAGCGQLKSSTAAEAR